MTKRRLLVMALGVLLVGGWTSGCGSADDKRPPPTISDATVVERSPGSTSASAATDLSP